MAVKEEKKNENIEEELNRKLEEIGLSINLVEEDDDEDENDDLEDINPEDIHFEVLGTEAPAVEFTDEDDDDDDDDEE